MTNPSPTSEVPGLPHHGDMAIDCGVATLPANKYWVTIREGGQNKTIMVDGPSLLRFAEKARQTVGANE